MTDDRDKVVRGPHEPDCDCWDCFLDYVPTMKGERVMLGRVVKAPDEDRIVHAFGLTCIRADSQRYRVVDVEDLPTPEEVHALKGLWERACDYDHGVVHYAEDDGRVSFHAIKKLDALTAQPTAEEAA